MTQTGNEINDDLWLLHSDEISLLPGRTDTGRLVFDLQLKFRQANGRYPERPDEIGPHVVEALAKQIDVAAATRGKRRKARSDFEGESAGAPFFDESKVPVQIIQVPNPEAQGLTRDQYEVIGEKTSHRLASGEMKLPTSQSVNFRNSAVPQFFWSCSVK